MLLTLFRACVKLFSIVWRGVCTTSLRVTDLKIVSNMTPREVRTPIYQRAAQLWRTTRVVGNRFIISFLLLRHRVKRTYALVRYRASFDDLASDTLVRALTRYFWIWIIYYTRYSLYMLHHLRPACCTNYYTKFGFVKFVERHSHWLSLSYLPFWACKYFIVLIPANMLCIC